MDNIYNISGKKIWIAGHSGLVGSALVKAFEKEDVRMLTVSHGELDLTDAAVTESWLGRNRPQAVIVAAAKVGGIGANINEPADFLFQNLAIAQNVIHGAYKAGVEKMVFLGSSCIYPKAAEQPIREEALLTGALEPSNEAYAVAKIAGIKLCQFYRRQYGCDFISLMPCNIYGPRDRWNREDAHVIPMLISRFHKAKIENAVSVKVWGSGWPLREFLYAGDLAKGIITAFKNYSGELHLNIGSGYEVTIAELAEKIAGIVGFTGDLIFDASKPDGCPRKILNSSRMRSLGWSPETDLEKGLALAYEDFLISLTGV